MKFFMPGRLRFALLLFAGLSLLLGTLGQVTGSFDDDDPDNDPNFCHSPEAPENCNWTCGWYQAAVNAGQVSLEAARTACPDLQRTDWLPEEVKREREAELERVLPLYEDDDPTNDPNECFQSTDPDCDWEKGWYASISNIAKSIEVSDVASEALKESFRSWLEVYRAAESTTPPDDLPPGSSLRFRWFCPPGVEGCPRPAQQCAPGQNIFEGGCYFHP